MLFLFDISPQNLEQTHFSVAVMGYLIVLVTLCLLFLIFRSVPAIIRFFTIKLAKKPEEVRKQVSTDVEVSGEVNAAISAALYLYFQELHDEEDTMITIQKVSRNYSPWSSKIYNVMNDI